MRFNSLTIDDFYVNPMEVREFALNQEFKVRGNYPGQRTRSFLTDSLKKKLRDILYPYAGEITYWGSDDPENNYTGSFQYTVASDRSWIHADSTTDWAAVCYLTPDAPLSSGTGIFWEIVDRIGNVFNRLIMYRADNYHVSLDYFGKDMHDGRLFQVFFFNTER